MGRIAALVALAALVASCGGEGSAGLVVRESVLCEGLDLEGCRRKSEATAERVCAGGGVAAVELVVVLADAELPTTVMCE